MTEPILRFDGAYAWLSNFYYLDPKVTTEHLYQAEKTLVQAERDVVMASATPGEAKRRGRKVSLRPDWEEVKDQVMVDLTRFKYIGVKGPMSSMLLRTGDALLVEGNYWHDVYWGVCNGTCRQGLHEPFGENRLGVILMDVRSELQSLVRYSRAMTSGKLEG